MKTLLLLACFFAIASAEIVDFGTFGNLYDIKEEDPNKVIKKAISEISNKKIEYQIEDEIQNLKTSHIGGLKTSVVDSEIELEDIYIAQYDVPGIYGELAYKKGDRIPTTMPPGIIREYCFVDGALIDGILREIIREFGKDCIYFVNNKNIDEFSKLYRVNAFPMGGQNAYILKRYQVVSLPTKITRFSDKKIVKTINIKRLIVELDNREKM